MRTPAGEKQRILAIHFPTTSDAVLLFSDCTFGRVAGPIAEKWRETVEALVEVERKRGKRAEAKLRRKTS